MGGRTRRRCALQQRPHSMYCTYGEGACTGPTGIWADPLWSPTDDSPQPTTTTTAAPANGGDSHHERPAGGDARPRYSNVLALESAPWGPRFPRAWSAWHAADGAIGGGQPAASSYGERAHHICVHPSSVHAPVRRPPPGASTCAQGIWNRMRRPNPTRPDTRDSALSGRPPQQLAGRLSCPSIPQCQCQYLSSDRPAQRD
jgi:hypothetical protein